MELVKMFKKYYEVPENMIMEYAAIFDTVLGILTDNPGIRKGSLFGGGIIIENIHNENAPYISVILDRKNGNIKNKTGLLYIVARNIPEDRIEQVEKYCQQFTNEFLRRARILANNKHIFAN